MIEVTNGNATHLEVSVSYGEGGMNYFTGSSEPRGLRLIVTPVSLSKHDNGLTSKSFTAFSGIKKYVLEMKRFSQKTLDSYQPTKEELTELVEYVKSKNGIETENY